MTMHWYTLGGHAYVNTCHTVHVIYLTLILILHIFVENFSTTGSTSRKSLVRLFNIDIQTSKTLYK